MSVSNWVTRAMQPRHQVSKAAIALIKTFEGYRGAAARLETGRWTIGYGHVLSARQGAKVSEPDAEALLRYDLIGVAEAVNEWTFTPLSQNQFDALCAFAFNIGLEAFRGSDVLLRVNEGQLLAAASAMELWRKAEFEGEVILVDGLVRRRSAEKALFLTPERGWPPTPSPVLRPSLDADGARTILDEPAAELVSSLEGERAMVSRDPQPLEDLPTATQLVAQSVAARLQALIPDATAPSAINPHSMTPKAPDAASWPLRFGGGDRAFVLTPPPESQIESMQPSPIAALAANDTEPDLFDLPTRPSMIDPQTQSVDQAIGEDDEISPQNWDPEVWLPEPVRINWRPILAVALPGLLFLIGGLFWSAKIESGTGLFHPWIVGWVFSLIGLMGLGYGLYRLLIDLGHIEPLKPSR